MEICSFDGGDFKTVFSNDRWKIGLLRHSERFSHPGVFERHLCTEEAFALLSQDWERSKLTAVCIGERTEEAARALGMRTIRAKEPTLEAVAEAMV